MLSWSTVLKYCPSSETKSRQSNTFIQIDAFHDHTTGSTPPLGVPVSPEFLLRASHSFGIRIRTRSVRKLTS